MLTLSAITIPAFASLETNLAGKSRAPDATSNLNPGLFVPIPTLDVGFEAPPLSTKTSSMIEPPALTPNDNKPCEESVSFSVLT